MRVITGTARGTRLLTPNGDTARPTTDKVKESIFNIIQFDVPGRDVLDLFAGTGQLAIEALSRGAESAVLVDRSRDMVKLIGENLKRAKMEKKAEVVNSDAESYLKRCRKKFGIIFLDPPYAGDLLETSLDLILEFDILLSGGIIVCERPADGELKSFEKPGLSVRDYKYGKTVISVYRLMLEEV